MSEAELRASQVSAPQTELVRPPVSTAPVDDTWNQAADVVPAARRRLRDTLQRWDLADLADDSVLVLSELLTNAVQHARGPRQTVKTQFSRLACGCGVRIEVHDADPLRLPITRTGGNGSEATRGRGLLLVAPLHGRAVGDRARRRQQGGVGRGDAVKLLRTVGRHMGVIYIGVLAGSFLVLGVLLSRLTD